MKIMFIDESGDHNLDPKKVDKLYPVFVLAGCIFDEETYKKASTKFNEIKTKYFGDSRFVLHTLEINRPDKAKDKRFLKFNNKEFRNQFFDEINMFLSNLDFQVVACVIKKISHLEKYGVSALDPYLLSFDNLLNRFVFDVKLPEKGKIIAERRNGILDNQLDIAWLNTKINGTELVKGNEIKDKIENLYIIPKSNNEAGLQIADLIVSPIGRKFVGIKSKPGNEVDYPIIEAKFRRQKGKVANCGLTILPKE